MTANPADAYLGKGANMEKIIAHSQNTFRIVFFILLVAISMIWTASPAQAVGPYFENESPASGQLQGPNPGWPRPDEPLWSSPTAQFMSIQSLKKGDIILKSSKKSAVAENPTAPVEHAKANQHVALR
jgi:hypothetical protein